MNKTIKGIAVLSGFGAGMCACGLRWPRQGAPDSWAYLLFFAAMSLLIIYVKPRNIWSDTEVVETGPVVGACFGGKYDGMNEMREGEAMLHVSVPNTIRVHAGMHAVVLDGAVSREEMPDA